jgi:hypothetical protein
MINATSEPRSGAGNEWPAAAGSTRDATSGKLVHSPFPTFTGTLVHGAARLQTLRWDRALTRVRQEQERALTRIVGHAKFTEYGARRGFPEIRSYRDFAGRVPVGDYDTFSPYIERMRQGEKNLLVPEFVRYFGNSSGSSTHGRSKFLPITERQIALQRKSGTDGLSRALVHLGERQFTHGFTLGLFPPTTMRPEGPVLITSNPALMIATLPGLAKPAYLPDEECRRIGDYEEKLTRIARTCLDHDVRALAGTTCWFSLMFEKLLQEAARRGRRARTVREIWPNLRILLGGGVSAEPYRPLLREFMGRDDFVLVDSYNATEGGIYAATDHRDLPGMLMMPHRDTFFEFLLLEEHDNPSARRVPLWEVELDRQYAIVVTTVSGLYAYKLGDIVRFPQHNRIEFVGRLSGCLSVTQELTTHIEIEKAVSHAASVVPCTTLDFGASAEVGPRSRYLLFVEFAADRPPLDLQAFARAFDEGLCRENRVYREHRVNDAALLPPRVVPLRRGGAKAYLDQVTRGNMQGKFPRIIDPTRRDQVSAFEESV